MSENSANNKRIAKNTLYLYIRMLVTMLLSLYTSRVLLKELGVQDFGIYGLVGGIVMMFASLKTMFAVATQRFLNIEIGRGDEKELMKVFNVSLVVNIAIAIFFILIVEIGGVWLLENKLNIVSDRKDAAFWVLQFSIIASTITILNIPFDANIIAREKMNAYAFISIIDAFLKLGSVLVLCLFSGDRLLIYGFLVICVTSLNFIINYTYCKMKFTESGFKQYTYLEIKDKFKEMFAFSGWAFLGNLMFALVNEGLNILLNIFGGVVANAARTITYQVKGAINSVVSNVYVAIKPQAIQSFAQNDIDRFYNLMFIGAKVVGYMYLLMAIPFYFLLDNILMLWLGTIPDFATAFIPACLLYQFVRVLHESIGTFFVTIGKLKSYQITEFLALGSALPMAYIGLKYWDMPLYGVFLVMTFSELLNLFSILYLACKIGNFNIRGYVATVLFPYISMAVLCFVSAWSIHSVLSTLMMSCSLKILLFVLLSLSLETLCLFCIGLKKEEKELVLNLIKR